MTLTTQQNPTTAPATLAAVRELAPAITSRAAEIEVARRLPPDLLEQLTAAGCFRILLPPATAASAPTYRQPWASSRRSARPTRRWAGW